ncbi:uncharacterized protein CcaverHIS019_0403430 [Cutaneotrichosporon cavernicola]|uniref:Bromodomain-containing protein n=1 Tax=Cutaneotrichosporon cavernicola TaxID=279322 RepID=A0AA48L407_9TREE|nr:uncharacterized protein CcaverHIS019_0403430 [Cutaneotrichosporon cavernicola]BEI91523.1 hypothetical protein CcaverHIS019_0403430 [Cutaneotrichosporon cavernicola]
MFANSVISAQHHKVRPRPHHHIMSAEATGGSPVKPVLADGPAHSRIPTPPAPALSPEQPNGSTSYLPTLYPPKAASPLPGAHPTPADTTFDPIPASSAPGPAGGDNMDVDRGVSPGSAGTKRPGDSLLSEGAKRVKEGSARRSHSSTPQPHTEVRRSPPSATSHAQSTSSAPAPMVPGGESAAPVDPNAPPVVYPWTNFEPTKYLQGPGPMTRWTPQQHKYLLSSVRSMLKSNNAANFRHPVDVVLFNIPHYPNVIDRPMDLGTVETKLIASDPRGPPKDKSKAAKWDTSKGTYSSVSELTADVRQIWENTRKFNGRDHVVSQMASKLEEQYEKALRTLPSDAPLSVAASSPAAAQPPRRQSVSQTPTIRRDAESSRPKREIHPPPSKDIDYNSPGSLRKPKRRNDPQLQWAARAVLQLEKTTKYYDIVSPFLYSVAEIIAAIPAYTQVIKKPIDLLMIKQRIEDNSYDDASQIDADMRQMCNNARTFNPPGDSVHNAANALLQMWSEKWRSLPPKQELREPSEEAVADESDSEDDDKDVVRLREAKAERVQLDREIAELERKIANKPSKQRKQKVAPKAKAPIRKYSTTTKASPGGPSANGVQKKARKPKPEVMYRDDDESDDEVQAITIQQQQELADKIQTADADILGQAVAIIQATTNISGNEEIELDMNSLPPATVVKLYNLVCKGRKRGKKVKPQPRKSGFGGAPGRKHLNEQEEADRIRKMEAQLQAFDSRGPAQSFEEESSSEEESSDEE